MHVLLLFYKTKIPRCTQLLVKGTLGHGNTITITIPSSQRAGTTCGPLGCGQLGSLKCHGC